jgi:hypothetical protein
MLSLNPYVILAQIAVLIALAAGCLYEGYHYKSLQDQAAIAQADKAVIAETETADQITANAATGAAIDLGKITTFTNTELIEVPKYVTVKADSQCSVPRGFVRLHDGAAGNLPPVPLTAGQSDDDPSGVELSAVADTITANYGTCNETRQQLIDLQAWIRAQAEASASFMRTQH